ncbi:Similar to conserved hypothetical protein [Coccidioides posadasii str. Silveira]; acc. no. EFW17844 [Pyronema omphalodes CBS 100304]|uniref:Rhodopsin domain-containing protein n=1 Tax=Pyronema omphalodes (strain CBS 100304) TaxID=1076935 RepID=U4LUG5_PYROM|nr:Similar to conserved hypothetical protein [Coccidioides posadasii str. Silveira]; acc. no. EFW17844 [Pyronema omphalodes CBS 100304]
MSVNQSFATSPDEWPAENHDHPETRGYALLSMVAFFFTAIIVIAFVGSLHHSWGHHIWDIPTIQRSNALFLTWITEMLTTWSLTLTKLSICIFYLRFLSDTRRNRIFLYLLMTTILAWGVGFTVTIVMRCTPIKAVWTLRIPGASCSYAASGAIVHVAGDIVTDLALYLLPLRRISNLRTTTRQKALISFVFILGAIVCLASILRVPASIDSMTRVDSTWHSWYYLIWTILECGLIIVVACLPALAPLLIRHIPNFGPQGIETETGPDGHDDHDIYSGDSEDHAYNKPDKRRPSEVSVKSIKGQTKSTTKGHKATHSMSTRHPNSKFKSTISKAFLTKDTQAAHSYPLAEIDIDVWGRQGGWEGRRGLSSPDSRDGILRDENGVRVATEIEQIFEGRSPIRNKRETQWIPYGPDKMV